MRITLDPFAPFYGWSLWAIKDKEGKERRGHQLCAFEK